MKHLLALPYEIWRDIKDYEGLYQVSNLGRVKSLERVVIYKDGRRKVIKETIVKPLFDKTTGYLKVILWKNGKGKTITIHRLVAEAFIPNPDNLPTVDHINRIKTDNRTDNLRWAPLELQIENRVLTNTKPIIQLTKELVFIAEYPSAKEAENQTGISQGNITNCCLGNRKSAGGYIWRYKAIK